MPGFQLCLIAEQILNRPGKLLLIARIETSGDRGWPHVKAAHGLRNVNNLDPLCRRQRAETINNSAFRRLNPSQFGISHPRTTPKMSHEGTENPLGE